MKGKILTKHPLGKNGRNIDRETYDLFKEKIIAIVKKEELTATELFKKLEKELKNKFSGNVSWYGETMKLDLEARGFIKRTSSRPQKYIIKK